MPSLPDLAWLVVVFFGYGFAGTLAGSRLAALADRATVLRLRLAERRRARQALAERSDSLDSADRDV